MKINIKDEKAFVHRVKCLVEAEEYSRKFEKDMGISFESREGSKFLNAASCALSIIFESNPESDYDSYMQILDNNDLSVDQKVELLLGLQGSNLISD